MPKVAIAIEIDSDTLIDIIKQLPDTEKKRLERLFGLKNTG